MMRPLCRRGWAAAGGAINIGAAWSVLLSNIGAAAFLITLRPYNGARARLGEGPNQFLIL